MTEFYVLYLFGGSEDKYRCDLKLGKDRYQDLNVWQVCQLVLCTTTMTECRRVYVPNIERISCLVSGFEHVIVHSEFLISLYVSSRAAE